jgi:hypothetical protein
MIRNNSEAMRIKEELDKNATKLRREQEDL